MIVKQRPHAASYCNWTFGTAYPRFVHQQLPMARQWHLRHGSITTVNRGKQLIIDLWRVSDGGDLLNLFLSWLLLLWLAAPRTVISPCSTTKPLHFPPKSAAFLEFCSASYFYDGWVRDLKSYVINFGLGLDSVQVRCSILRLLIFSFSFLRWSLSTELFF